jgi:hypothetical protein
MPLTGHRLSARHPTPRQRGGDDDTNTQHSGDSKDVIKGITSHLHLVRSAHEAPHRTGVLAGVISAVVVTAARAITVVGVTCDGCVVLYRRLLAVTFGRDKRCRGALRSSDTTGT